jgi:2-oxoisovalerate dehydrogenase E1 component beta subunit
MPELSLAEALREALRVALDEDERTLLFGEDVGRLGGVFRVTDGLQAEFGDRRVFDTPLAEAGIVGLAVGLCMAGWRPIAEIQFDGFSFPAFNQVASHVSKLRTRSRGAFHLPLTVRIPSFGGISGPEHHSESVEAFYAHLPGVKVASPSSPAEGFRLLLDAIRDPDPVIFLEPKSRYWTREAFEPVADRGSTGYSARVAREGRHVTLVAWGSCVPRCLEVAGWAEEDGVEVEVVDLRWLKPLDDDALARSVGKTGRAVVVQEAPVTAGLGAEVSARLMETCFRQLKAPVVRVAGPDVPYPCASLEAEYLPTADRILLAIQKTLEG